MHSYNLNQNNYINLLKDFNEEIIDNIKLTVSKFNDFQLALNKIKIKIYLDNNNNNLDNSQNNLDKSNEIIQLF